MVHNTAAAAVLSSEIDFVALTEPVARRLLGNPNKNLSKPGKIRWGSHGSFLLNTETGVWWDFEREEGGGPRPRGPRVRRDPLRGGGMAAA
jgi:hypothetical protein